MTLFPSNTVTKDDEQQQPGQQAAGAQQPDHAAGHHPLHRFWPEDLVVDLEASYYQVLSALSQDIVRLARPVLHEETSPNSHNNQRTSLMASHSLQLLEDGEDDEASYTR